jgi:hypothetical protein
VNNTWIKDEGAAEYTGPTSQTVEPVSQKPATKHGKDIGCIACCRAPIIDAYPNAFWTRYVADAVQHEHCYVQTFHD